MKLKIRIIGPCGSGKSYLSKQLSEVFTIPKYEIDNMIWDRCIDNLRFPEEVRNATLTRIVNSQSWIVEGVQYSWTEESFEKADIILILNSNVFLRDYRIIRRYLRMKIGIEPWNYNQSPRNLIKMIVKWNHGYNLKEVMDITSKFVNKRYCVNNLIEAEGHIQDYLKVSLRGDG